MQEVQLSDKATRLRSCDICGLFVSKDCEFCDVVNVTKSKSTLENDVLEYDELSQDELNQLTNSQSRTNPVFYED